MVPKSENTTPRQLNVDPLYSKGEYFSDTQRHSHDAAFKANNFLKLFSKFVKQNNIEINSFVDVGCGSGDIIKIIADSLNANNSNLIKFKAYDVSPHIQNIKNEGIEYINGDFCESDEFVDVVTLFDVFEHVPDPIEFIKAVAKRCKIIGFHIPLDNSIMLALRNKFRHKLRTVGHLLFMDTALALNLLALSGLKVVDYEYTFAFLAPSGYSTIFGKLIFPLRYLLAKIIPWLLSKTLGGASLIVLAITKKGLHEIKPDH